MKWTLGCIRREGTSDSPSTVTFNLTAGLAKEDKKAPVVMSSGPPTGREPSQPTEWRKEEKTKGAATSKRTSTQRI